MKPRKILKSLVITIAALTVAGVIGIGLLFTPLAKDLRSQLVSSLLAAALDRPVLIAGETDFELSRLLYITATDVSLGRLRAPVSAVRHHHVGRIRVGLAPLPILSGQLQLGGVVLTGARILVANDPKPVETGRAPWSLEDLAGMPTRLLKDPISDELEVRDFKILVPDDRNGWGTTLNIEEFVSSTADNGTRLGMRLKGKIGKTRISASGKFPNPKINEAAQTGPYEATIELPGLQLRHDGSVDLTGSFARIEADITATSQSLGDFLELLQLQRVLEGTGELKARVTGTVLAPRAQDIDLAVELDDTSSLTVQGNIANVAGMNGVELDFDVNTPQAQNAPDTPTSIYDIHLEGFSGTLLGNPRDYYLENFTIRTNAASGELSKIGPIWIERITRNEDGLLGLKGIRVLSGPIEDPVFDLSGNMNDTLQLKGFDLAGTVNLRFADILDKVPADNAEKLGRLKGEIVITDAPGILRVDRLDAKITGTDLLSLHVWKDNKAPTGTDLPSLNADLDIPDFDTYSALFGLPPKNVGPLSYRGSLEIGDRSLRLSGVSKIGKTETEADIVADSKNGRPHLSGSVYSKLLHLVDLRKAADLRALAELPDDVELELTQNYLDQLGIDMDIQVDQIAGGGKAVSGLKTKLLYAENAVRLDPFQVSYLGGTIKAAVGFRTDDPKSAISLKGRIDKLKMGTILKQLGLPQAVTGSLNLSFDLTGQGPSAPAFARTISGKAAGSIWGGSISNRVIDLLGQSVVSWMFGGRGKNQSAKLVCAVLPLRFKNGAGTSRNMIVETENVQIVGGGSFDMRKDAIDIAFRPRPKKREAVNITTSFAMRGKLSDPQVVVLEGGGAGRVVGEVVTAPISLLGKLFSSAEADKKHAAKHQPCVLPKASGPK